MSKKSYRNRLEAYVAARIFAGRGWQQEPYRCDKCGAWHLRTKKG